MSDMRTRSASSRAILGICVVVVGVLLTAGNLGLVRPFEFWQFFPLGLTALGVSRLIDCRSHSTRWFSILLIVSGLWWTLDNVYYIPFHIWRWWPVLLIVFGVQLVMRSRERAASSTSIPRGDGSGFPGGGTFSGGNTSFGSDTASSAASAPGDTSAGFGGPSSFAGTTPPPATGAASLDETITAVAFWSGSRRRSLSQRFRSADAIAVMGGVELDLRQASTATGEAILDVFVMWGAVRVRVPPDWAIINEVVPIMGGADDRTTGTQPPKHRLRVRGVVVMGGVDIRS